MRRYGIIAALACALVLFAGAHVPEVGVGSGVSTRAKVGRGMSAVGVGEAKVDTVRVRSRSALYPNASAIAAGYSASDSSYYDYDNKGDDGTTLKFGYVQRSLADSVLYSASGSGHSVVMIPQGTIRELDFSSLYTTQRYSFVWVASTGLKPGMKVESAYLMINAYGAINSAAGNISALTCRLDTVTADYAMVDYSATGDGYFSSTEASRFAVSWNHLDGKAQSIAWSPSLEDRLDWHDFGPRAATTIAPASFSNAHCFRFDVTDAVQQVLDNAAEAGDPTIVSRGFLFIVSAHGAANTSTVGNTTFTFTAGQHATNVPNGGGNPVFVCEATTKRGQKPWGGARVPVVFTFDDNKDYHTEYMKIMRQNGLMFAAATNIPTARTDSLYCADIDSVIFMPHTPNHSVLGELAVADLDSVLNRIWLTPASPYPVGGQFSCSPDTSLMVHFAYPSGGGREYSPGAVARLVEYGYKSGRGRNHVAITYNGSDPTPLGNGAVHYLYWSRPMNMYAIMTHGALDIATGSPSTDASVKEELYDVINMAYNAGVATTGVFGRGAIVLYVHNLTNDGITDTEVQQIIDAVGAANCSAMMDYDDLISLRLAGASYLDPATITEANGYTAPDAVAAAVTDSFATAEPSYADESLRIWVAPK